MNATRAVMWVLLFALLLALLKDAIRGRERWFTPPRALVCFQSLLSHDAAREMFRCLQATHYHGAGMWIDAGEYASTHEREILKRATRLVAEWVVTECVKRFHILSLHVVRVSFMCGAHESAQEDPADAAYRVYVALDDAELRVGDEGSPGCTKYALDPGYVVVNSTARSHRVGMRSRAVLRFDLRMSPHTTPVREMRETRRNWEKRWSSERSGRIRVMRPQWVR